MNVIFTVLFAFQIGFFVKTRGLAIVTYLALDALLFHIPDPQPAALLAL